MKYVRRIVYCLLLTAAFLWVNLRPIPKSGPTKRIQRLAEGCELLWLFCVTATATILLQLLWLAVHPPGAPGEAGHLPRGCGGSEPREHPRLRCAGVLCKVGGGFETSGY